MRTVWPAPRGNASSESRKLPRQLPTWQFPVTHAGVALGRVQMAPQLPQLERLVLVFTSQPSPNRSLQSSKPAAQVCATQAPRVQPGTATLAAAPAS